MWTIKAKQRSDDSTARRVEHEYNKLLLYYNDCVGRGVSNKLPKWFIIIIIVILFFHVNSIERFLSFAQSSEEGDREWQNERKGRSEKERALGPVLGTHALDTWNSFRRRVLYFPSAIRFCCIWFVHATTRGKIRDCVQLECYCFKALQKISRQSAFRTSSRYLPKTCVTDPYFTRRRGRVNVQWRLTKYLHKNVSVFHAHMFNVILQFCNVGRRFTVAYFTLEPRHRHLDFLITPYGERL